MYHIVQYIIIIVCRTKIYPNLGKKICTNKKFGLCPPLDLNYSVGPSQNIRHNLW